MRAGALTRILALSAGVALAILSGCSVPENDESAPTDPPAQAQTFNAVTLEGGNVVIVEGANTLSSFREGLPLEMQTLHELATKGMCAEIAANASHWSRQVAQSQEGAQASAYAKLAQDILAYVGCAPGPTGTEPVQLTCVASVGVTFRTELDSCGDAIDRALTASLSVGLITNRASPAADSAMAVVCDVIQGETPNTGGRSYVELAEILDGAGICPGDISKVVYDPLANEP